MSHLYLVSRSDLPVEQQAVQATHAALEFAFENERPDDWHPNLVHLSVRNKQLLILVRDRLEFRGIPFHEFHEPDYDRGLTAISTMLKPEHRHLLSGLKLWRALPRR